MIDNQCFSFAGNFISESKFPQWSSSSLIKLFPNIANNTMFMTIRRSND